MLTQTLFSRERSHERVVPEAILFFFFTGQRAEHSFLTEMFHISYKVQLRTYL
jgi:hypothetical protein